MYSSSQGALLFIMSLQLVEILVHTILMAANEVTRIKCDTIFPYQSLTKDNPFEKHNEMFPNVLQLFHFK